MMSEFPYFLAMRILISLIIATTMVLAQFGKVEVTIDDRLLRDNERQELSSLRDEITRFYSGRIWDDDFSGLKIPLHISFAFQGMAQKGGLKTFHAQVLISDGMDLRYFDKSLQFYFSSGGAIHFDPVIFDPLGSFLAYYAYAVMAGYMDTYEFYGGNHAYDQAREIALRGIASDFPKGWSSRVQLLKEVTGNKGLREARFAYYVAMDLFDQGKPDAALKEFGLMMDGLKKVAYGFPVGRMQYFLKAHTKDISHRLTILGQDESLRYLADIDPENKMIYLRDIKK
ncbi:MAG: DUF4835 family protein [Candidatus Marinimicrobia bacterium]|nr:DUF4835 family protein [Candidatus Neomarinimicrobiota bacterium]MBT6418640.1 DUF4835 family protein [Candidatus Neomarinimicrobiota bacterium]